MAGAQSVFRVPVDYSSLSIPGPISRTQGLSVGWHADAATDKIQVQSLADTHNLGHAKAVRMHRGLTTARYGNVPPGGYILWGKPGQGPAASGGGGTGAGGAGSPLQGATNALVRTAGQGQDIQRGAVNALGVGSDVRSEFTGINSYPPDTQIQPHEAKYALNVDSVRTRGALGKRPGLVSTYPNRTVAAAQASGTVVFATKANMTNADWWGIISRDGIRYAVWFDFNGSDVIPAAATAWLAAGATGSDDIEVDIQSASTAEEVAAATETAVEAAISSVEMEKTFNSVVIADGGRHVVLPAGTDGNYWTLVENVTHATFVVTQPTGGLDGLHADHQGRSINALPAGFRESDRKSLIVVSYDKEANTALGVGSSASGTKLIRTMAIEPTFGAQKDIRFVKPIVSIVTIVDGANGIDFNVAMPARFRLSGVGANISSVDKLVVLVSTLGFAYDRDNGDKLQAVYKKEYTDWDGTAVTVTDTGVVGTRRYYTVFALSKRHVSQVVKFYIDPIPNV